MVVYIRMNNVGKKEDYSGYVKYMNDFYKQYDNDVGFKILKNNIKEQDLNFEIK